MDDNKILLTLINGDRIPLPNSMRLVFETPDLRVSSFSCHRCVCIYAIHICIPSLMRFLAQLLELE
jgi:hypothetical protein